MELNLTRRRVLHGLAAGAATLATRHAFSGAPLWEHDVDRPPTIRFGAQTNAFPIEPARFDTFLAALGQIKATGYSGFETGFINLRSQAKTLPKARQQIESTGLTFLGVHIFLLEYDAATSIAPRALYQSVARQGAELGAQRLILSGAPAVTPDEVKRKADGLNVAGEFAATLGLKLAYHNHWWEAKYKAKELEGLYANTDPTKVRFLMDIGHASRTDLDLPTFVSTHAARLTGLHFRDFVHGKQVPLGQGNFPLKQVAAALERVGWSGWVINEEEREDGSKQGLTVIAPSFKALKKAFSA